jgi:hypothetical protein
MTTLREYLEVDPVAGIAPLRKPPEEYRTVPVGSTVLPVVPVDALFI